MEYGRDAGLAEPPVEYVPPPSTPGPDRLARLRLIRSRRVGPATFRRLLAEHGSAEAALTALPSLAKASGVAEYAPCSDADALAEMRRAKALGADLICYGDPDYPARLAQLADPPPMLWCLGDAALLARPTIAIVGTRNASSLGARMARKLARDLGAAGFVIVSGLARGIDALAHGESLATGTIAVQAGGLDVIYPPENADLAKRIGKEGLRLTEQPFGMQPVAHHFPTRNRIVAGLAQAVVVVEAAARSGSLITARLALDLGREVLAVPGHPMDSRATGCNHLIRDGAVLIRGADDVLELLQPADSGIVPGSQTDPSPAARAACLAGSKAGLGPNPTAAAAQPVSTRPAQKPPAPSRAADRNSAPEPPLDAAILAHLSVSPIAEDGLIRDLGGCAADISAALAELELGGLVQRRPGGLLALAPEAGANADARA